MNAHANLGHLASVLVMLDEARKSPTRVGMRVRLKNLHDVTGVDQGPSCQIGDRLIRWDRDGEVYRVSSTQIEEIV